jgi:hypothetical protein
MVADIAQIGRADAAGKIGGWHRLPPFSSVRFETEWECPIVF